MANYVFETMTQEQAAAFNSGDYLIFSNAANTAISLMVMPTGGDNVTQPALQLSGAGRTTSLTFNAANLSASSTQGRLIFNDNSVLTLGTNDADTTGFAGTTGNDVIYGFGGADSLGGLGGNDYLYGGNGADTLAGGDGNDHLYGSALTGAASVLAADGADSIIAGAGNDYVNGNGGADFIDGGTGNDRLNGGGAADTILGGDGNDIVNGNQGDDSITGGDGNDILRGGQGNDIIAGGTGNDIVYGDLGADTVSGGAGFDVLFGGNGTAGADTSADVFQFTAGDASTANIAGAPGATGTSNIIDIIGDYQDGTDKIDLNPGIGSVITAVTLDSATTPSTFGSLNAALTYAQQLADNSSTANANEVVALNFNGNTVLFTASTGTTIDTAIQVTGVGASVFDVSDFI